MPVENIFGVSIEELFISHSKTKMGVNLSTNDNDALGQTQMKGRMFEIPAGAGLLVTEYHEAIENFYEIDKEIITFKTPDEFNKKVGFLLRHPKVVKKLASNGYKRFLKEHDSKVRLRSILQQIRNI
jgi:spore maturation protein CgeB